MARNYTIEKPTPQSAATAIAMPKDAKGTPKSIKLSEEEERALRLYISGKRSVALHEASVKELVAKHGKLAYREATVSPNVRTIYHYDDALAAEKKAVDEKLEAARASGDVDTEDGALSLRFADKAAKPAKKGGSK